MSAPRANFQDVPVSNTLNAHFLSLCQSIGSELCSFTDPRYENQLALSSLLDFVFSFSAEAWSTLGATPTSLRNIFIGAKKYKPV